MNEFGIFHLKDEKFDTGESRDMQLLIRIAPKRISYAIVSQKDNRLLVLYDAPVHKGIEDSLNELLQENNYLKSAFAAVKVSVETLNFTLIPIQYYTKDDLPGYEKLVQAHEGTKTFISTINTDAIKCVIALELEVTAPFISAFSQLKLMSQVNSLVEGAMKITSKNTSKLVLQFNYGSFEASYSVDEKLVISNLFTIANADDFNYFLLMLMQQLNIDASKTSVFLAGDIEEGDVYFTRVEKYFNDINFAEGSKIVSFPAEFNQEQTHKYFSLLSLKVCE
ncbi:MAG: DUF3822 family protein [Pyrinomonadaceae bacterium]|nr:DUF3822 family protein [Sphingobacteriaceae bacterium]